MVKDTTTVSVRLGGDALRKLRDAARVTRRTTSDILRQMIERADARDLMQTDVSIELRESAPDAPRLPAVEPTAEDLREAARQCTAQIGRAHV